MNDEKRQILPQEIEALQTYYQEDEISLVDLWLVFEKHKKLFVGILLAFVISGLAVALTKSKQYSYTTSIEIARSTEGLLEEPGTVLAKLQQSYIPLVINEYENNSPEAKKGIKIDASIPKGSEIIVLNSKGSEDAEPLFARLHQSVVEKITRDHDSTITVIKAEFEAQLHGAENKLGELRDKAMFIENQVKRLDEKSKLISKQIDEIGKVIEESRKNRIKAVNEVTGEAKAMTLLLIDNEIQQYQERESMLIEQLHLGLASDRDTLKQELANNSRAQAEQQEKILEMKAKIANILKTRAITPTMRSQEPIAPNRKLIIAIAAILGLIAGLTAVFAREFAHRVKEKKKLLATQ